MVSAVIALGLWFSASLLPAHHVDELDLRQPSTREREDLSGVLEPFREKYEVPGLVAAVVRGDEIVAAGAVGLRRIGREERVTVADRFHIGSCTKSFTSMVIAILVEDEALRWDTKVIDVFPELTGSIDSRYHAVTIEHLLSHTSGLPNVTDTSNWFGQKHVDDDTAVLRRRAMVNEAFQLEPAGKTGDVQVYSNRGYGIVAAVAEELTGETWYGLVSRILFDGLGLESAGFGWAGSSTRGDEPWGHMLEEGALAPIDPDGDYRIPAEIAPAGDIHMSALDLARWLGVHLRGLLGETDDLLPQKEFERMHNPVGEGYGLGWRLDRTSGGDTIHWHNGSGNTFFATMAIFPDLDLGIVVLANRGDASAACQKALFAIANDFANR